MKSGYFNLTIGTIATAVTLATSPYAFGGRWVAWSVLLAAGIVNIVIGIWAMRRYKRSGDK